MFLRVEVEDLGLARFRDNLLHELLQYVDLLYRLDLDDVVLKPVADALKRLSGLTLHQAQSQRLTWRALFHRLAASSSLSMSRATFSFLSPPSASSSTSNHPSSFPSPPSPEEVLLSPATGWSPVAEDVVEFSGEDEDPVVSVDGTDEVFAVVEGVVVGDGSDGALGSGEDGEPKDGVDPAADWMSDPLLACEGDSVELNVPEDGVVLGIGTELAPVGASEVVGRDDVFAVELEPVMSEFEPFRTEDIAGSESMELW